MCSSDLIPLIADKAEFKLMADLVENIAKAVREETKAAVEYTIGTMIELPRACLRAGEIAERAEFFSFGTNDLTQTTWGFSRDDVEAAFFSAYLDKGVFGVSPFESIDRDGVGELVRIAAERGRAVRNGIKANCVFQACREMGVARTTKEIADAFGIPARDLSRTTEIFQEQVPDKKVHVTTPADLIGRFLNDVTCVPEGARGRVKMKIIKGCQALDECVELMGRTPKAVACAVIFHVLNSEGFKPSKAEICRICDVSVPTLGKIETIVKESGLL